MVPGVVHRLENLAYRLLVHAALLLCAVHVRQQRHENSCVRLEPPMFPQAAKADVQRPKRLP
jgi:hypothetical protein